MAVVVLCCLVLFVCVLRVFVLCMFGVFVCVVFCVFVVLRVFSIVRCVCIVFVW